MEKLWAVMVQKVDGLDDTVRRVMAENEEDLLRIWNHHKCGDDLHTAWKESIILSELERFLSRVDQHSGPDLKRKRDQANDDEPTISSLNGAPDYDLSVLTPDFCILDSSMSSHEALLRDKEADQGSHGPHLSQSEPRLSDVAIPPLPASASSLLNHYFIYTHCWFPILDRLYTLKKFYEHTRSPHHAQADKSDLAYLWAISAYTKQQTIHLTDRSADTGPSVDEMRAIARRFIPSESGPFALGHVHALLLLALLDMGMGKWTSAWILVGFAVRALLAATDSSESLRHGSTATGIASTGLPQQGLNGIWRGALQGSFILDTVISLRLGRPPHMRSEYLGGFEFIDEDGLDEWEPWNAAGRDAAESREPAFVRSCFNRLTELCMLANNSLRIQLSQNLTETPSTQDNGSKLLQLAEKYPFRVMEIEQRPPHQMLVRACHFVVAATSSTISSEDSTLRFLQSMELFGSSRIYDNCGVPSILTGLFHSVSLRSNESEQLQRPMISEHVGQVLTRLAIVWPGFEPFVPPARPRPQDPAFGSAPARPSQSHSHSQQGGHPSNMSLSSSSMRMDPWPNVSPGVQFDRMDHQEILGGTGESSVLGYGSLSSFPQTMDQAGQLDALMDYGGVPTNQPDPVGQETFGASFTRQRGATSGTATSPSFNGDEIDALFHEMAQLDTTQWSTGRTQGLKDFGFADDSTFEAFCNDPDRLTLTDAYAGDAFDKGMGDVSYAAAATFASGVDARTPGQQPRRSNFDIFHPTWE